MLYDDGFLHVYAELEIVLSFGQDTRTATVTLPDHQSAASYDWLLRQKETHSQINPNNYTVTNDNSQITVTLPIKTKKPIEYYLCGYLIGGTRKVLFTLLDGLTETVSFEGSGIDASEWMLFAWSEDTNYYVLQESSGYTRVKTDTTLVFTLLEGHTNWQGAKAVSIEIDTSKIATNPFALGTSYDELTYDDDGWPINLTTYATSAKARKILEEQYTRDDANDITEYVVISYGIDGVEDARVTEAYEYDENTNVLSITRTES